MSHGYVKTSNYNAWAHGSNGYLTTCKDCGKTIYVHFDGDKQWRCYESWVAGNADWNTWIKHDCLSLRQEVTWLNNSKLRNPVFMTDQINRLCVMTMRKHQVNDLASLEKTRREVICMEIIDKVSAFVKETMEKYRKGDLRIALQAEKDLTKRRNRVREDRFSPGDKEELRVRHEHLSTLGEIRDFYRAHLEDGLVEEAGQKYELAELEHENYKKIISDIQKRHCGLR